MEVELEENLKRGKLEKLLKKCLQHKKKLWSHGRKKVLQKKEVKTGNFFICHLFIFLMV
jgi:hypothetical protein